MDKMSVRRCLPGIVASALAIVVAPVDAAETGIATWYGARHEGRRTSSGDVFHQDAMTAASSRLPLGTRVRVTMPDTGSSVVVLVNDHMGGHALIDLSRGAAKRIGLYARGRGVVSVENASDEPVEVAEAPDDADTGDLNAAPRGRRHRRRGDRAAALAHACCHAPSVILARHSVQPRAARHSL